jgi:hypothetical protein
VLILELIQFDRTGLHLQADVERGRAWYSETGLVVELTLETVPPAFPVPLHDPLGLAKSYREFIAHHGAGLVELTVLSLDGCPALRTIVKTVLDPQTGWGRSYLGTLRIPFRDFSFLLKAQSQERGVTGFRETALVHRFLQSSQLRFRIEPGATPPDQSEVLGPNDMKGWLVDEDDPTPPHLARNRAEDPEYDTEFPDHPLSQVRAFMNRVQPSVRIAEDVKASFPLWTPPRPKPRWRFW